MPPTEPYKHQAARTIQRFWQKKKCAMGLSGAQNYDYYLTLLSPSTQKAQDNMLAQLMFGRVISTPKYGFPFIKQLNPFIKNSASYHRLDYEGSDLIPLILRCWNHKIDRACTYIPVVDTHLGSINEVLTTLNTPDYELVEAENHRIKFIKINAYNIHNHWWKLSGLGIIASPWLISQSVIASGVRLAAPKDLIAEDATHNAMHAALNRQPSSVNALKTSLSVAALKRLSHSKQSGASLLAEALYAMIHDLPADIEAPDNVARLALFLETALMMHQDDHARLANYAAVLIHELSLLVLKYSETHNKPYIDLKAYQSQTAEEIKDWCTLDTENHHFIAVPANSGTHAHLIASIMARDISQQHDKSTVTLKRVGNEYWEVRPHYNALGIITEKSADIIRCSAGPVGDYYAGTHPAIDINKLIRQEAQNNKDLKSVVIDTTSASFAHLKLAPDVITLITQKGISLLFWESGQKFGLLHSDQAQYGRVFAFCHKKHTSEQYLSALKEKARLDITLPDAQIAAFIQKNTRHILSKIREQHFENGLIWRTQLLGGPLMGINDSNPKALWVDNQRDPFVNLQDALTGEERQKVSAFFQTMQLRRTSFGHRYSTEEDGIRISAGSEHPTDTLILAKSVLHFITHSQEALYEQIQERSIDFNLHDRAQLIDYLSLIKAWSVYTPNTHPMSSIMAQHLRAIITHKNRLKKTVLNGSEQCVSFVYTLLETHSPFHPMLEEARRNNNPFAVRLFEALHHTFAKTGRIDIDQAIKKASENPINTEQLIECKKELISGAYSQKAFVFFGVQAYPKWTLILKTLEEQEALFSKNREKAAARAIKKLQEEIQNALIHYTVYEDRDVFKTQCIQAIQTARTELQQHDEWKDFLAKLLLGIMSLGIIPAAIAIHHKIHHGNFAFRLFDTKNTHRLNELEENIEQLTQPTP